MCIRDRPCTAKKAEIKRPEHWTDGEQDVDYVSVSYTHLLVEKGYKNQAIAEKTGIPNGTVAHYAAE